MVILVGISTWLLYGQYLASTLLSDIFLQRVIQVIDYYTKNEGVEESANANIDSCLLPHISVDPILTDDYFSVMQIFMSMSIVLYWILIGGLVSSLVLMCYSLQRIVKKEVIWVNFERRHKKLQNNEIVEIQRKQLMPYRSKL